jgi:hypothetical protein
MAKTNVPALLAKLKALGYTVYAWKEGEEQIPEGLTNYIEALASKMAAEEMEKFMKAEKEKEWEKRQQCDMGMAAVGTASDRKFQLAGEIARKLSILEPSDQNRVIKWVTESVEAERDERIRKVRYDKARIDTDMKHLDRYLLELTNSQDQLNEQ